MALIDFRQVAAPSFNDANSLMELAAKQGESAITGLQKTWVDAMGAVQNRNHADMQTIINQQTAEELKNPENIGQLMEQFKTMVAPTGNNYDPTIVGAALDGRIDILNKREGVMYDNMDANIGVQQGGVNLANSILTNQNTQDTYLRGLAGAEAEKTQGKAYGVMSNYMRDIRGIDRNSEEGQMKLAALTATRDAHLAELYPDGMPPEVLNNIYTQRDKENRESIKDTLNIEGKQYANEDAKTRIGLAAAKFASDELARAEKTGIASGDRATSLGINRTVVNPDGSFNPGAANQDLMSRVANARRELTSPSDSKPFSERVNDYMGKGKTKDGAPIDDDKLRQLQKSLNVYTIQSKDGKSLQLTDDEKWAVFQGMMSGEIQSDKWSVGSFGGLSNYQGLFEEVIPPFLERYKKQTIPNKQNLNTAKVVGEYFTALGGLGDQVYMAESMGIEPNTELFMYMPEHIRVVLDPKGTDKRRYTDVPSVNESVAKIAKSTKKNTSPPSNKKPPKTPSGYAVGNTAAKF